MAIYSLDLPISSAVAVALGWTLLHALWQGFVLVLPAALLIHISRRSSSQLRYNIGVGALLAQVMLSMATFGWYYQPVGHAIHSSAKAVLISVSAPAIWPVMSRALPWPVQVQQFLESHLTEIVLCWLIGVVVFLVRLAGGWLYVQRLKTTAVQPADQRWQAMQARLSSRLAVWQSVRVLESAQVLVPMVVGALKPVILLPVGLAAGLSMDEAEAILSHELAHIKRFDYGVNLLQSVVEVMYFFHPALWWLSARVREERENCCDDLAVLACGNVRSLAQALTRVEEFGRTPVLAMALASRKKLLLNRVRRMLGVSARPVVSNGHLLVLTVATVLLATASVYAIQDKKPQPKPRKTLSGTVQRRKIKTSGGTEFSITDKRKVEYVVWKGQKLPAGQVATLQRQLDQVMAGQLNLDDVQQPDRDILLQIIEANYAFDKGVDVLNEGEAQLTANPDHAIEIIDSMNIDEKWMERQNHYVEAQKFVLKSTIDTSRIYTIQRQLRVLTEEMQLIIAARQPMVDSMTREITELSAKSIDFKKATSKFAQQQAVLAKQQTILAEQQAKLAQKLPPLNREIQLLSQLKTTKASQLLKQKKSQNDLLEKQMNQLGDMMGKLGSQMGDIGQQMQPLHTELQPYQERLIILSDSISKLYEPTYKLSENIRKLSEQITEEVQKQSEAAVQQVEKAFQSMDTELLPRPAYPPRPPKPIKGVITPWPAPEPAIAPVAPVPRVNVRPAKPAAALKPVMNVRPAKPAMPPAAPKAVGEPNN